MVVVLVAFVAVVVGSVEVLESGPIVVEVADVGAALVDGAEFAEHDVDEDDKEGVEASPIKFLSVRLLLSGMISHVGSSKLPFLLLLPIIMLL